MPNPGSLRTVGTPVHVFFRSHRVKSELRLRKSMKNEDHGGPHRILFMWSFPSMVNMRTMVGIDLVKSLVNFFFRIFDGYITGSLGPAGSQIRKKEIP